LLADHDLDLAKIEFARAEAAYQQSRAAYHRAQEKLNNSELHAPFDAVVVARRVQPAETVVSELRAEPMLVIAAADKMLARFSVPAGELSALSPGQKVIVEIAGNRYQAVVTAISLDASNKQGAFSAEAEFATEQRYLPGVPLTVSKP
jgi:multidrug resistance efflux pump